MSGSRQSHPSTNLEAEDAKNALRKVIRAARSDRSERRRALAAAAIADVVDTVPEVALAGCVASYAARAHEPDTAVLHARLERRGARVLLPVLGAGLQRDWAVYAGPDDLQVRAPGRPPEPGTPTLPPETLAEADVVLAPALAVDTHGVRLGQGGGWYDRALGHVRPGVTVVAVVFPEELYDANLHPLPFEAHDLRVDAVVTPDGWHRLDRR